MAVTFDAQSFVSNGTNVATKTLTDLTVGAGSNRALVVGLAFNGTQPAGITVIWDVVGANQAMTPITGAAGQASDASANVILYGLVAPVSGNKVLTCAWTGLKSIYIEAVAYAGVDQTGGDTSFPNGNNVAVTSTNTDVTVTSAVDDAVVAIYTCAVEVYNSVNNTEVFRSDAAPNTNAAGNRAAGAATVLMRGVLATSHIAICAGTSVKASTGGVVTLKTRKTLLGVGL